MELYKIRLEKVGKVTSIPDSQRIFGWLMQQLTNSLGSEDISALTGDIKDRKIKCMVSNLLPENYYPTPKKFLIDRLITDNKEDGEDSKKIYKDIKKMDYILKNDLKNLLKNVEDYKDLEKLKELKYLTKEKSYLQKFRISSQFYDIKGYPNDAYSVSLIDILGKNGESKKYFNFLVKTNSEIIKKWMSENRELSDIIFLGARASQGFNSYKIKGTEKLENKEEDGNKEQKYLNLGMLIPNSIDKIDMNKSYVDIHTSERRPYSYYRDIVEDKEEVISFISEGGVIYTNEKSENIGKSIDNPFNIKYKNSIVFGNSLLVPLEEE